MAAPIQSIDPGAATAPADGSRTSGSRQRALLALATSGAWTSVAVLREGPSGLETHAMAEPAGTNQSARLLALIGELLGSEGVASIDAIAFEAGPGAFTGLRIGCSVAQGLGFARGLPLLAVGSLEAAAWRSFRSFGVPAGIALVANDARMGELYAGVFAVRAPVAANEGPRVELLVPARLARPGSPPEDLSRTRIEAAWPVVAGTPWCYAGDAWNGVKLDAGWAGLAQHGTGSSTGSGTGTGTAAIGSEVPGTVALLGGPRHALPGDAQAVAELGWTEWCEGRAVDVAEAFPRYVRDKVALDVDEQRRLRESGRSAPGKGPM